MTDPYINQQNCVDRLLNDYNTHKSIVVAFDFDNTIHDYHKVGDTYPEVTALLKQYSDIGIDMFCFTANPDHKLVMETVDSLGIKIFAINESPLKVGSGKPFYSILLDDRAGLESAYTTLKEVMRIIIQDQIRKIS